MTVNPKPSPEPRDLPAPPWVILFVDDEPDILESLADLIGEALPGVRILTASSGRAGLDVLAAQHVDLVVSDFRMPGMDGIEFLYQVKQRYPAIPRVMLTAFPTEELANRAVREAFVDSFLSKAAEPDALVGEVAALLKRLHDRPPSPAEPSGGGPAGRPSDAASR